MRKIFLLVITCVGTAAVQAQHGESISPLAAVSRYVLDGETVIGPSIGLRFQTREFDASRFGLDLGVVLKPSGVVVYATEPFIYSANPYPLYRFQPPMSNRIMHQTQYGFGLGFVGLDWRTYLADGDIRPYLGVGASLIGWSASSTFTGTVSPDVKGGLDVRLSSRISGFAEATYVFGSPTLFGSKVSSLSNITVLAVGVNFIPRW